VYGLLRTSDAFSQAVTDNQIIFSLVLFLLVYTLLFTLFIYLLNKKIKHGPFDTYEDQDRPNTKGIATAVIGR